MGWFSYIKSTALTLIRPANHHTLAFRNFLLAILVSLIPGIGSLIAQYPPFSDNLPAYLVALGLILATASLSMVYFNHAPEPFSFNVKLVGISLVAFLTIFAAVGVEHLSSLKIQNLSILKAEVQIAQKAVLAEDMTALPESIAYIIFFPNPSEPNQYS